MDLVKDNATKALNDIQKKIIASVYNAIKKDTTLLTTKIKNDKLSNNVLNVRSGNLRNSIHNRVVDSGNVIKGEVFSDSKYAAAHEYGFNGSETVKAHMMRMTKAYGKPIQAKEILVRSFTRHMKIKQSSFMRSSLNELENTIYSDIDIAVKSNLNG